MVIELKNVIKDYGERKILEIENLKIEENEKIKKEQEIWKWQ